MLDFIFGSDSERRLKNYKKQIVLINAFEKEVSILSDEAIKDKKTEFQKRISAGESLESIVPEAFAVVREASKRTLGQRHYDVQMLGGISMLNGDVIELQTGEGKTLVATLTAYVRSLKGKVHIVTVNDYLARRDAVWMGQIYDFLGLNVSVIQGNRESFIYDPNHKEIDQERDEEGFYKVFYEFLKPVSRTECYKADVVYGANNEYVFDYLRDNTVLRKEDLVQQGLEFVIIDEADSVLIDEARSPLIISSEAEPQTDNYIKYKNIASKLEDIKDYEVDQKVRTATLTDKGITKVEQLTGYENFYVDSSPKEIHMLEKALDAKALFLKDKHYVVQGSEVVIVDEFTGRLQHSRRWRDGVHQAIEAKEGLPIQVESKTIASITYQNYFRLYKILSGMTGTAKSSAEELYKVYGAEVTSVPTHREKKRIDKSDKVFKNEIGKFIGIKNTVKKLQELGQPVLVGTTSVEKNEKLHELFKEGNVPHEVLNAKNHEKEGEIIANAGKKGQVTIATNLAGRGVDIKLGGVEAKEKEYQDVKELGGLYVIGTERHESRRIDDQLRGRSGRQGDEGETQFYVSMEDDLLKAFGSERMKNLMEKLGVKDEDNVENKFISKSIESAQTRVEGHYFDARKGNLEYDNILNTQREEVYKRRRLILLGTDKEVESILSEISNINFKDDKNKMGEEKFYSSLRVFLLMLIDFVWVEHLELMDYARSSVNLRSYGQNSPLVEYKKEAKRLFEVFFIRVADLIEKNKDNLENFLESVQR